jgi:hypothetical protein
MTEHAIPLPPAVVITIPLEGLPRIEVRYSSASERLRVDDWLLTHDDLLAFLARAAELEQEWKRERA